MGIGLSIVFTGLCALVTDGERASGQVLLVDAPGVGEVAGVRLPEHAPTLVISLASLANPESSRPTRVVTAWAGLASGGFAGDSTGMVEQLGLWDLRGAEVRIRVQGENGAGLQTFRAARGGSSWPAPPPNANDPAGWRDLRFIAEMKPLAGDGRIDPTLVANEDTGLPRAVAARIHLDAGILEAAIPSQTAFRDDVFEFRSAGELPKLRQALTDTLRWSLDTDAAVVVIEISPATGGPATQLVLTPRATRHELFVSNLPVDAIAHRADHTVSADEMAALHFGAYYKLLRDRPANAPLPRLWVPPVASRGTGNMGPIICPPAAFTRN
jgi:hypothetical protein